MIEVREEQADNEYDYERSIIDNDDDDNYKPEPTKEYVIDDSSLLRYDILLKSYYSAYKMKQYPMPLEEYQLFSEFPPPRIFAETTNYFDEEYDSELNDMLQEERPGLLDIGWVSQVRAAHKASRYPMKVISLKELHSDARSNIDV